jgi:hypothetical protein
VARLRHWVRSLLSDWIRELTPKNLSHARAALDTASGLLHLKARNINKGDVERYGEIRLDDFTGSLALGLE